MDDFTRVKEAVDLVDVVSRHVELKRAGTRMVGCCPFHHEKSPSFGIPIGQSYFKCFGCGAGGDVFTFLHKLQNISRFEALQLLAEEKGIVLETKGASGEQREARDRALRALADAQELYRKAFASPVGTAARELLERRHLDAAVIDRFGLGYAPVAGEPWRSAVIAQRLVNAGHRREDVVAAGIAVDREDDHELLDSMRDRVTIPIRDERGCVIAFGGRRLRDDDERNPKYINSRETLVFSKSHVLYGLDQARASILKSGVVVLVEGYMDVILAHQGGLDLAIAALGTSVTADHARHLARLAPKAVLFLDSDAAGQRAAERAVPLLLAEKLDVKVLVLKGDKDPGDFFARGAMRADFDALLASEAVGGLEFLVERAGGRSARAIEERIRIARQVGANFQGVADPLVRTAVVEQLARSLDLPAGDLDVALGLRGARRGRPLGGGAAPAGGTGAAAEGAGGGENGGADRKVPRDPATGTSLPTAQVLAEEEVLIALLRQPALRAAALSAESPLRFGASPRARLFQLLVEEEAHAEPAAIVESLLGKLAGEPEAQQTLTDLVSRPVSADPGGLFDGAWRWFERRRRNEQLEQIRMQFKAALAGGDPTTGQEFLRTYDQFRRGGGAPRGDGAVESRDETAR
ncbi:MAG: DNA primase [Planctomycetes bacterium]|nr:DNA primase [Planctomycetota bacterium]